MFNFDARAVAFASRGPYDPDEAEDLSRDALAVARWAADYGGDLHRACQTCDRYHGFGRRQVRSLETATRPPGTLGRDSCRGCFVSFFDRADEHPPATPEHRQLCRDLLARWRELFSALADVQEAPTADLTERKLKALRLARIKAESRLNAQTAACREAGFDPKEMVASGLAEAM